ALARIDPVRAVERLRRAGVEAAAASAAVDAIGRGGVGLKVEAGKDHAEEQPAAMLAADEVGVLALPPDARRLGERLFHHRCGIDEHFQLAAGALDQPARERLQRLLDRLVIVTALGIDRDAAELRLPAERQW